MLFEDRYNWQEEIPLLTSLSAAGMSMAEIARKYEISKQRIFQIFQLYKIPKIGLALKKVKRQAEWDLKWGKRESSDVYTAQRQKFRSKKYNAKRTGIDFSIQFGEVHWPTHCPILGIEIDWFAEQTQENSPSFDRINPAVGYVAGNVHIISWRANRIKNDGSANEHRLIADYLDSLLKK